MLMIGIGLEIALPSHKYLAAARHLGVRYGLSTCFALAVWWMPLDHFVRIVLCMLLFAPMPSMTAGFVAEAKNDVELSTFITSLSIVVGIVVMPLILVVLGG